MLYTIAWLTPAYICSVYDLCAILNCFSFYSNPAPDLFWLIIIDSWTRCIIFEVCPGNETYDTFIFRIYVGTTYVVGRAYISIRFPILLWLIIHSTSFLHKYYIKYNIIGTLTQPANSSAAFSTFENGRRKMSLGIFNTLAGLSFDKSSSSDSSRRSSSPEVPVYDRSEK